MQKIVEHGRIYFFYRPRSQADHVEGLKDIYHLYILLSPDEGPHRLIGLAQNVLPKEPSDPTIWGLIIQVNQNEDVIRNDLATMTAAGPLAATGSGEMGPARPAGEGQYSIVHHEFHSELAYVLELPADFGPVQKQLHLESKGALRIKTKNPLRTIPPGYPDPVNHRQFPIEALDKLGEHGWVEVDRSELLNHRNVPVLFSGVEREHEQIVTAGIQPEKKSMDTADVFEELGLIREGERTKPLVSGEWE